MSKTITLSTKQFNSQAPFFLVFWTSHTEGMCFGNHYGRQVTVTDEHVCIGRKLSPSERLNVLELKRFQEKKAQQAIYGIWTPLLQKT